MFCLLALLATKTRNRDGETMLRLIMLLSLIFAVGGAPKGCDLRLLLPFVPFGRAIEEEIKPAALKPAAAKPAAERIMF